jgi:putative ATP-dependent endonuclease of the OLD family
MYIKGISIKNFRNFKDTSIDFTEGFQTIIGENNIGKSNLYRAMRLVFDKNLSYRDRFLDLKDFHGFKSGLTLEDYVLISADFCSKDLSSFPNFHAIKTSDTTARVTYIFAHKSKFMEDKEPSDTIELKDFTWRLFGGGASCVANDVIETCAPINFKDIEGINLYYITAFRNINTELQGNTRSLLSKYCQSRRDSETELNDVRNILKASSENLNMLSFIADLAETIGTKGKHIAGDYFSFPISISFLSNYDVDAWNQLNLFFNPDAGKNVPINVLGLGQKNILYLSLFIAELENSSQPHEINLLLIEEPEAHLHPQLQKILFSNLKELKTTQVFMTSHSTHIASDCDYKNLNILYHSHENEVKSFSPFRDGLLSVRESLLLKRYLDATRSELFFASTIILVEGVGEQFIIPAIAANVYGINLTEHNISVIPIHCRYFEPYLKLVQQGNLEIPTAVLIDGDSDELEGEESVTTSVENALKLEVPDRVKVCVGTKTLEVDLFPDVETNSLYLAKCFANLGHKRSYDNLVAKTIKEPDKWQEELLSRINNTAKKGRFAQELSLLIDGGFVVPDYIVDAILHIAISKENQKNAK